MEVKCRISSPMKGTNIWNKFVHYSKSKFKQYVVVLLWQTQCSIKSGFYVKLSQTLSNWLQMLVALKIPLHSFFVWLILNSPRNFFFFVLKIFFFFFSWNRILNVMPLKWAVQNFACVLLIEWIGIELIDPSFGILGIELVFTFLSPYWPLPLLQPGSQPIFFKILWKVGVG